MASLSHRQGWSLAVLLALLPCFLLAGSDNGDTPPATYRTGTSEVRINFYATDDANHLVSPIAKNDFAVIDGGMVIRDFRSLLPSQETALDVLILVDASESVGPHFDAVKQQVERLISQVPASDRLAIATFSGLKPRLLCAGNCADATAAEKLRALSPAGATPLFDALKTSASYFDGRKDPDVRQVVILFSDGNDTISAASAHDALAAVNATGALLYAVDLEAKGSRNSLTLQEMAEATGGRVLSKQEAADNVFQSILADLHASYVVTYALPSRAAGFHTLRILPQHNLNLRFHCRKGYSYDEDR